MGKSTDSEDLNQTVSSRKTASATDSVIPREDKRQFDGFRRNKKDILSIKETRAEAVIIFIR